MRPAVGYSEAVCAVVTPHHPTPCLKAAKDEHLAAFPLVSYPLWGEISTLHQARLARLPGFLRVP